MTPEDQGADSGGCESGLAIGLEPGEGRLLYGQDPDGYDLGRPRYPAELYDLLVAPRCPPGDDSGGVSMGKLVHLTNVSLDLLIEDEHGSLDWGAPSHELFVHLTNLIRPLGTHLYGRRLHETIAPWETGPELAAQSDLAAEFAGIWAAASSRTSR